MGTAQSSHTLLESSFERVNSTEHRITEWDRIGEKNFDYYMGKRMCVIPIHLYPQYVRGYLWGHYTE